jgi:hypothetical protein
MSVKRSTAAFAAALAIAAAGPVAQAPARDGDAAVHAACTQYMVLEPGTPVYTSDGTRIGVVKRVLADVETDIFDGIIVDTADWDDRFVDAPNVDELYENAVVLKLSLDEARHMPEPTPNPAYMEPTPDDIAGDTPEDTIAFKLRQAWNRISGNY